MFSYFSGGFPGIDSSGITGRSYEAYQPDSVPRALAPAVAWELRLIGFLRALSHCSDRVWTYRTTVHKYLPAGNQMRPYITALSMSM